MNQAQTPRSTKTASIISAPTVVPSTQSNKGKIHTVIIRYNKRIYDYFKKE